MAVDRVKYMYTDSQVTSHFLSEMNESSRARIQTNTRQTEKQSPMCSDCHMSVKDPGILELLQNLLSEFKA